MHLRRLLGLSPARDESKRLKESSHRFEVKVPVHKSQISGSRSVLTLAFDFKPTQYAESRKYIEGVRVLGGTLLFYHGWGEVIVSSLLTVVHFTLLWRRRHGFGVKVVVFSSYLKLVVLCSLKDAVFYWWAGTTLDFFFFSVLLSNPIHHPDTVWKEDQWVCHI